MVSPETQDLARRLVASQAQHFNASPADVNAAAQVVGELRLRLVKLAGVDGFRSLLARALTLAKAEAPSLQNVQVRGDGALSGLDEAEPFPEESGEDGVILIAHLLELLLTFIGEPLTLHLVRDAWIDAFPNRPTTTEEKA